MSSNSYNELNHDFSLLPKEIQIEYLLKSYYKNVLNYCHTSKSANEICNDNYFWKKKARYDLGMPEQYFDVDGIPAFKRYLYLIRTYNPKCFTLTKKESNVLFNNCLSKAIKDHDLKLTAYFTSKHKVSGFYNRSLLLKYGILYGNLDIVKFLINYIKPSIKDLYYTLLDILDIIYYNERGTTKYYDDVRSNPYAQDIFKYILTEVPIDDNIFKVVDRISSHL